jgi:HipA-like C-terminal domain
MRLADRAGIATPEHELVQVAGKAVLLSRRFDRADAPTVVGSFCDPLRCRKYRNKSYRQIRS